ncbi:MAG: amino acid adenylation domain-containing protein [Luteolibacter sp.]
MSDLQPIRPISPLQAAMLRDSLAECSGRNVEQVEVDFSGDLSMSRVIPAWLATVERTAALASGFLVRDGEPCGIQSLAVATPVRTETETPSSWGAWLAADRMALFPLIGGLPWRVVVWPDARKLIWTFHHALLDGGSIAKILRAFHARLIDADDPGDMELALLAPPGPEEIQQATEFHRRAFAGVDAFQLEFPGEENAPASVSRCLGHETVTQIEAVALSMEITVPTMITWAWGQAVARTAGAEMVAVGQVRSGPPLHGQAGFSMNTVPLVIPRAASGPAIPVLRDFRQRLLDMRSIETVSPQELPPGIFQETGGPWPGGVIMVQRGTLHDQVGKTQAIESITLHEVGSEPLLACAWIRPELRLEVEVNGSLYGARVAESLLDQWAAIVTGIAEEASTDAVTLTDIPVPMLDSLAKWESGGDPAAHFHLAMAWRDSAEKFATRNAIWTTDGAIGYSELAAQVEHLAACLQEAGLGPGHTVASMLWNRRNLALVLLAVARVGAINVPLDPTLPQNRLRAIIDDAGPLLILSDDRAACAEFSLPCTEVDGMTGKTCATELSCDPRATLAILYTSGSTGRPKGVMMVHGGVTNEALGMAGLAGIQPGDRVLQFASPGFDASLEELLATLLSGATLVPRPENLAADLDEFHQYIRSAGITVLDLSTAHWAAWCAWMVSEKETIPEQVRTTIIGGERASAAAVKDWFEAGGRQHLLINTYGPTEASIVGTAELIRGDWNESGDPAIGRPLPGVFARVGDASGRSLPPGAAGELWLGGICVGDGYWQRPDLTADAFHFMDGRWWYRTGDRVYRDDTGDLRFLGRQDDQLKIRGNRVEPNEVIRVLELFPGVSAAHAGPVSGPGGSNLLAAWVRWSHAPEDGWPGQLAVHAAAHLPTAAIPTRWAVVEEFILTERGKLDRRKLPAPCLTASKHASSDPPATPTEIRLAEMWSTLLGIGTIGRDESFFELGGHSLAALQLFAQIAREWKIRIPMAILIQAPTPRLLGQVIDRKNIDGSPVKLPQSVVVPVRPDGHLPPLFCIHGGDGGVFFYQDLAKHLPSGRPLLAIESPALAADEEVRPVPVEETAATYLAALREHQAQGPFHLAGYSYGGLLVYEMARQLIAEGETVAFAGLFDTVNPAASIRQYTLLERAEVFWGSQAQPNWFKRLGHLLTRTREGFSTHFRVKGEIRAASSTGATEPYSEIRMLKVREAHWKSMEKYQPGPLACHITLFKSEATDDKFDIPEDYGWGELVKSMEIVEVPGKHLTMFAPRYVGALAGQISKRM